MAAAIKKLNQNDLLFKEGDASESMFVVKKGRLLVFKLKGTTEIELATVGAGEMIGEMAFFDGKPRSASIKAVTDAEVIELPFKSLQAQFDGFPEWLKALIKTINEHLREANKRIKNLEQVQSGSTGKAGMTPHQANKCCGILMLVTSKFGTPVSDGIDVKPGVLRKFTIQVFQEPTTRMGVVMSILQGMGILKQEDLGEGKQRITMYKPDQLADFTEWFNEYLYTEEAKRITVEEPEIKYLKALIHFGKRGAADDKGKTKISLTEIQNESMKELSYIVTINELNGLIKKGIISDKVSEKDGTVGVMADVKELERTFPFWQLFYALGGGGA